MKYITYIVAFLLSQSAVAVVGLDLSAGQFDYEIDGSVRDGTDTINLDSDLGMRDDDTTHIFAYIETAIPLIPHVRVGSTDLDITGSNTISVGFTYNGQPYTSTQTILTDLDLSHTEIGVYWDLPIPAIDIDFGLNVKMFDGGVTLDATGSGGGTTTEVFDETVPMLYFGLTVPILNTGIVLAADMSTIEIDGDSFTDTMLRIRYESTFWGIEYGNRDFDIDYTDLTESLDLNISGQYLNFFLTF